MEADAGAGMVTVEDQAVRPPVMEKWLAGVGLDGFAGRRLRGDIAIHSSDDKRNLHILYSGVEHDTKE